MLLAGIAAIDVLWICLAAFLVIVAVALAFVLIRLAGTAKRLTDLLGGVEEEALPVITKVGGTVDRVNLQLDKADVATTSAVDAVVAVDKTIRTVTGLVTWPIKKISAIFTGARHGLSSVGTDGDVARAYAAGLDAATRREQDIEDEMSSRPSVLDEPSPPSPDRHDPMAEGPGDSRAG